ncbi:hypothetical protein EDD28_1139 [Salana multivorans]|uniref:Uncharacterized protein n=1 Tax=Salana multivorans TaxID=120377 RepID=A0A3N2DAT3_9MICO|nr:hypothetical protein EDD28_1139 [Salana multivorans]
MTPGESPPASADRRFGPVSCAPYVTMERIVAETAGTSGSMRPGASARGAHRPR